jgi:glycosyltransferase involved in cell wall biosynthesis
MKNFTTVLKQFKKIIGFYFPALFNLLQSIRRKIWKGPKGKNPNYDAGYKPYEIKLMQPPKKNRKKILHVISNFWTGGSAQLVVDLVEHLGHEYEQEIITRDIPNIPAYSGIPITLCTEMESIDPIISILNKFNPHILHVHYLGHDRDQWGKGDSLWYDLFFKSVKVYGCKIVENINIPTQPYSSEAVSYYVYVSKYVMQEYGLPVHRNVVIYPGSNFSHFKRLNQEDMPDNCIGMVYRLERDKINESSIEVFIEVVKRRRKIKVLIVGGGSLLEYYRNAVATAGLTDSFIFTGYVAYEDLPELYKKMSIFVAPVHRESFGQVTSFAMNMSIPVTGYYVGALPEIINNDSLLAPAGDFKKLSEIIIDLLDNRQNRLQTGAANQQRAKELFSVESMINCYSKIYDEMMDYKI